MARFAALSIQSLVNLVERRSEGHLWVIALGLSLLANVLGVACLGWVALESTLFRKPNDSVAATPPSESVATIFAEIAAKRAEDDQAPEPVLMGKRFVRTTPNQAAPPDKKSAFMGERNTRAASDRKPNSAASPLPSQAGVAPKNETDIETTESNYKDGSLTNEPSEIDPNDDKTISATELSSPLLPTVEPLASLSEVSKKLDSPQRNVESRVENSAPREKLLEGPNPVDVAVLRAAEKKEETKPPPNLASPRDEIPPEPKPVEELAKNEDLPKPKPRPTDDPVFQGNQRKTAVMGSISRTGQSSLDVEDSMLGRYQASISRAVEQEWQRNCVRHRDFITPGFLTVRFYVETSGKVRSVQFVGDMETGEVQKGFTLNAIRDADIPVMPPALRKEYLKEPLELIFRFYF